MPAITDRQHTYCVYVMSVISRLVLERGGKSADAPTEPELSQELRLGETMLDGQQRGQWRPVASYVVQVPPIVVGTLSMSVSLGFP